MATVRQANPTASKIRELIAAARDQSPISGLTHNFYRYPARFSAEFVRAAIQCFSRPGNLVLDPYMGGGPPEVLNVEEVQTPTPADDEVLMRASRRRRPGIRPPCRDLCLGLCLAAFSIRGLSQDKIPFSGRGRTPPRIRPGGIDEPSTHRFAAW